jgi:hypothetical protein
MAKRSYRELFVISGDGKGYIWNYFQKPGVVLELCGLWLDFKET